MLKRWEKLNTEAKFENPWWTYRIDKFQIPGGPAGEYHYVQTNGASMVVPVADDGRILLVKQYRYLWEKESLEFPCGSVKVGHSFDQTAQFELEEETGFQAGRIRNIGSFNPCNGLTSETCRVYLATRLKEGRSKPDPTEEFEVSLSSSQEFESMIARGVIWDGMTLAAWMLARQVLNEPVSWQ